MSEPRKNHLNIDGGQVKEDEHIASYKPIPESDTEYKKPNLTKSKEKLSADGAEEKLLEKEKSDDAKITTRVDMADAKYVVGDHRNGDAKIELDANKRQFSGLTKEELLKYADDPFWVRLRWFMFVLFWALWLCMLIGAIVIIVKAPKCATPPPKLWFETGPLVDASDIEDYKVIEEKLPLLAESKTLGIFTDVCSDTYEVLNSPTCIDQFKEFAVKAKMHSIKVIVDLTANFVSKTHEWFAKSENRTEGYADYFIWAKNKGFKEDNVPNPPNNWVSTLDGSAWTWSETRKEFYLHQFGEDTPDLNFTNPQVVLLFDQVIGKWLQAGADGIRLHKARHLVVDPAFPEEVERKGRGSSPGADHLQYAYWQHRHTTDLPALDNLFAHWSHIVDHNVTTAPAIGESVFTLAETSRPELFLLQHDVTSLRPRPAAPLQLAPLDPQRVRAVAAELNDRLKHWPSIQLTASTDEASRELLPFSVLLPATPVLNLQQLVQEDNTTSGLEALMSLRRDASVERGAWNVSAVNALTPLNSTVPLLAVARWMPGHTGYVAVWNPHETEARASLLLPSVPASLQVHYLTSAVKHYTNLTSHSSVSREDVLVPPLSGLLLSYVPISGAVQ